MPKKRSRRALTLRLLEQVTLVPPTDWPQFNGTFTAMSGGLQRAMNSAVMDVTWDASTLEEWMWDSFNQKFTFVVRSVMRLDRSATGLPVVYHSTFSFDPKRPWLEELDRVSAAVKDFSERMLFMQKTYFQADYVEPRTDDD